MIMRLCLLITIGGLFVSFGVPARAQGKNAVDPQVRKQIAELNLKYDEAFNQNDAEAVSTLFTADAVETGPEEATSGQQEIEDRYKILFESHPNRHVTKLDQVYAIGHRVCAIAEWSMMQKMHASQPMLLKEGYVVTVNVHEGDDWKVGMLYWSYK
jgi:uncharacterized protein (TIGR02246 family)